MLALPIFYNIIVEDFKKCTILSWRTLSIPHRLPGPELNPKEDGIAHIATSTLRKKGYVQSEYKSGTHHSE